MFLTSPPADSQRLFVVERGLLSLAFHPQYAANGRFYVYFTDPAGNTRVVRYVVSADPNVADSVATDTVLKVVQPYSNHNGAP